MLGRFITADNVIPNWHDPQALDRYAYVRNNPLKYVDPDGHEPVTTVALGVGAIISFGIDYYSKWKQSGKNFVNYYKSGEYSTGRALVTMSAGAATTGTGGVIAGTSMSLLKKATAAAVANVAIETGKNKMVGDENTSGKIAAAAAGGSVGQMYGKVLNKSLNALVTKEETHIIKAGYTNALNSAGERIPFAEGVKKITPEYWAGTVGGQLTGAAIEKKIVDKVKTKTDK